MSAPRVLHVGKFLPPLAGGVERFLFGLLDAAHRAELPVAALVHDFVGSRRSGLTFQYPVFRATAYGQLLHAPVSPGFPLVLERSIRQFRPDILHLHLPNTSAFAVLMSRRARRLPWVIHWHADVVASRLDRRLAWTYPLYRPLEQALLARSARIIATSPPYLESSSALLPWRERTTVVPLGIEPGDWKDPSRSDRAQADEQWGQGLRVLGVGRLAYYKGFDVLIDAVARTPGIRLLLVGEGPEQRRLERMIVDHGLQERAELLGFLKNDRLRSLMATSDVVSVPSVERTEAFGMVALEAMCYGKPVIASDIPGSGLGWVVREAGHGVLMPPGDSEALSGALERFQREPELGPSLGAKGAARLGKQFHIGRTLVELNEIYAAVIRGR